MLTPRSPTVDRRFFAATAEGLLRLGFDVADSCHAHGLPNPLTVQGDRIPLSAVSSVFELAAATLGKPDWIYQLATHHSHEHTSVFFPLVGCCPTPLASLRMICRHGAIVSDAIHVDIDASADRTALTFAPAKDVFVTPHQVEMSVWLLVLWLHVLRDEGIHIHMHLQFAHQPLFDVNRYAELYDCVVAFGATSTRLWLSGEGLYQSIPGHDEHLLAHYRHHAERYEANTLLEGELAQRVMLLFAQRMAFGKPNADDIAALLNVSRRTLQRQLREAGTSWSETIDRARQHAACTMLEQADPGLAELALLTGYEDTRAFLRAFKRWTGLTPSAYRITRQG